MDGKIFATWFIELYPDLMSLRAHDGRSLPKRRPGLINRTEVRGFLTEDRCGLVIAPHNDPVTGYYVTDVGGLLGVASLDEKSADEVYEGYGDYMALLYISSESSDPEIVGVFHPRSWKEEYPSTSTTPASFRLPAPLFEEYKEVCNFYNESQTAAVVQTMWNKVVERRFDHLSCVRDVVLGNGEKRELDPTVQYLRTDAEGER
ncbi:hypothetical protein FGU65_01660 [Methanoculleus sp. FWC-SCC1]|uniref:Uncharacterized protein n=1 Tax=Methanoculleus frigidifontis TaxID=2584085 RepID=A0ABT8M6S7_9EURY|nr:hypothetical protein [Methanoculleus sp. FWC-SCC1]MDN7023616.1 hypothetical protein [Methanoculleus sp. FWC-SCC1]